jgi:hypothetical protein
MRFHEFDKPIIDELSQRERKERAGVEHDQFFTRPEVAKMFQSWVMDWVKQQPFARRKKRIRKIEPAAGNRDIAKYFRGIEMYDLDPQHPNIKQQDFLQSNHQSSTGPERTIVIMNPPFGKSNKLAIAFFNKAAEFADIIAQIVPKSFSRTSIHDRLNYDWHLVAEVDLPKNSFYLKHEGPERGYNVNAVMQIWVKGKPEERRTRSVIPNIPGLQFLNQNSAGAADVAIGKWGNVGNIILHDDPRFENAINRPTAFWYIKAPSNIIELIKTIPWHKYGASTGQSNLGKGDIQRILAKYGAV